ncbi:MAG: N-acetylmuramoyl-L-alanine amidase [Clostridia bacterium]
MICIFKKQMLLPIFLLFICVISLVVTTKVTLSTSNITTYKENPKSYNQKFIIDAGHGGEDPGTSDKKGNCEKNLNLDVSLKVGALLSINGYDVTYTRTEDKSVDTGEKFNKRQDILNRIDIVNSSPNGILLSFHMNFFPESKYYGAQVFYNNYEMAKNLALDIQNEIYDKIDNSNTRQIKKVPNTVFLFSKSNKPSVLIECGFLSNSIEAEKLSQDSYRTELALAIFNAIIN